MGQGQPQVGVGQGRLVAAQGEVANLHRRTNRLHQGAAAGAPVQVPLLVAVEAAGEQHIDFAAEQGAK